MIFESPQDRGFLPNLCQVTSVFMLVLLVELLALVMALIPIQSETFWDRLALISLFSQWLALINASLLCLLRKQLNRLKDWHNAAFSFGIMMSTSLLLSLLVIYFSQSSGVYDLDKDSAAYFLLRNLAISTVIYIVVLRYFYIQHQWLVNIEAQSRAQLQALKARIRPHFLFNSMNTIASLISIDAAKAEKAVEDLSDLFRASLTEKTSNSLADEIALTRSYLDIEMLRLGDRLKVEWQLDDAPMGMELPALCLQPLVENAIFHGIEPLPGGGLIKIRAQIENNRLCLSVTNPLSNKTSMTSHKGNHMAQQNIRQRLELLYGNTAAFEIEEQNQNYKVTIKIPTTA